MSDHPLRSDTDRSLGKPLPYQLANLPQAPLQTYKYFNNCHLMMPLHYAVLAVVSDCYSPLKGRLPTCYSPVRHFISFPKESLIVRLACLRHAASVDSEPGSNSRLKVYPSHHYPLLVKYPNNDSSRESPFWPNRSPTRFRQLALSARLRMLFYHRTLTPKGLNLDTLYLVFKDLVRSFTLNDRPSY